MARSVHRVTGQVKDTATGEVLKAGWGGPWLGSMAHHNAPTPTVSAQAVQGNGALHTPTADPNINPREAVELANRLVVKGIVDADPSTAYPSQWLDEPGDLEAATPQAEQVREMEAAYPPEWLPEVHQSRSHRGGITWEGTD